MLEPAEQSRCGVPAWALSAWFSQTYRPSRRRCGPAVPDRCVNLGRAPCFPCPRLGSRDPLEEHLGRRARMVGVDARRLGVEQF